jgi:hypothetical protein
LARTRAVFNSKTASEDFDNLFTINLMQKGGQIWL